MDQVHQQAYASFFTSVRPGMQLEQEGSYKRTTWHIWKTDGCKLELDKQKMNRTIGRISIKQSSQFLPRLSTHQIKSKS
jgi:hypothetical protein